MLCSKGLLLMPNHLNITLSPKRNGTNARLAQGKLLFLRECLNCMHACMVEFLGREDSCKLSGWRTFEVVDGICKEGCFEQTPAVNIVVSVSRTR